MRHLDLFSGIGGFALAASWVWGDEYENVGHREIEEYACKVYHRHFPTSPHLGDITKVKWNEGQADIITGGFPCQPHSMAGKRKASEDERDLWSECKRAVSEIRPRYALFENVAGLLTSERGRFFNRVLSDLAEIGYDVEWHNIPASALGAPHKRERIWIIATKAESSDSNGIGRIHRELEINTAIRGFDALGHASAGDTAIENAGRKLRKRATKQDEGNSKTERGGTLHIKRSTGPSGSIWSWDRPWMEVAAEFCRVDDGLPHRVDRLKGLGNAIVPQVAQVILQAIKEQDGGL